MMTWRRSILEHETRPDFTISVRARSCLSPRSPTVQGVDEAISLERVLAQLVGRFIVPATPTLEASNDGLLRDRRGRVDGENSLHKDSS